MNGGAGADEVAAVELVGVRHRYPDGTEALRGIDLHIGAGERVAVLGPNGAGKTTLVLHLNAILRASAGEVRIGGRRVGPDTETEVRRRVGVVFQDPDDQLFMPTVRADVAFGPRNFGLRGEALAAAVDDALDAVALAHLADRAPHHLSRGERRRAAVATVLACGPEVLVLDEPSADLDPRARRELADLVLARPETVVIVTHDLLYAAELCERAVVLDAGRVVADGAVREVLGDAALLAEHRLELPRGVDPSRW